MNSTHESEHIFEIAQLEPVLPDIWFVQGRAYRNISAGETVAIEVLDSSGKVESALFKVVAASTYGYLLSELNSGMTGGLTIVAQGTKRDVARYDQQLRSSKFLLAYQ